LTEDKQTLATHATEHKQLEKEVKDSQKTEKSNWTDLQKGILKVQKQQATDKKK